MKKFITRESVKELINNVTLETAVPHAVYLQSLYWNNSEPLAKLGYTKNLKGRLHANSGKKNCAIPDSAAVTAGYVLFPSKAVAMSVERLIHQDHPEFFKPLVNGVGRPTEYMFFKDFDKQVRTLQDYAIEFGGIYVEVNSTEIVKTVMQS